ncbi:MAG: hypothetical protein ACR2IP_12675 [Solirubrobacteraceae bacterium]
MTGTVAVVVLTATFLVLMRVAVPHRRGSAVPVTWHAAAAEPAGPPGDRLAPAAPGGGVIPAAPEPRLAPARPGERLAWLGSAGNRQLATGELLLADAIAAAGLRTGAVSLVLLAVPLVLAAAELSRVRVTVSAEGVRIGFGHSGLLAQHLDLARIRRARAGRVDTLGVGGYGFQDDSTGTRLLVGCGECLGLELDDGSDWIVSVRSADGAARVVNTLVAQRERRGI